ncbi:13164_t:CDS:1, partial [Racocetra persica]
IELFITNNQIDNLLFSTSSCNVKPNKSSIVWYPLLPNLQYMQVLLTKIPSVLDLYIFDIILSGVSSLSEGYTILAKDCTNKSQ